MRLNANHISVCLLVTAAVAALVLVLPWADRRICRKLGLSLNGGVSTHPEADRLLRLRQWLLLLVFGLYVAAVAWLVFFSRTATQDYKVHVAVFQDLKNAIQIDFGLLGLIRTLWAEGFRAAGAHIRIISPDDIAQAYMNLMLFVPMGYLLPYVFAWFRARPKTRPVIACFLLSLLIENLQLITKRGFYDMDDLISNTLGGLIGAMLFIRVAYVVTHPDWRKERRGYLRWKKHARARTLYPFARKLSISRTTLLASHEEAVWDFYVDKLGFRLKKQLVPQDSIRTDFLLEMGRSQVVIRCSNQEEVLPPQVLTIAVKSLAPVRKRLEENGIHPGPDEQDPYTGARMLRFSGPDSTEIAILGK